MGFVKGMINTVKNMGSNLGKPPKKKKGKFRKRSHQPGRAVTRGGGGLR
jgi:hypothetical protein